MARDVILADSRATSWRQPNGWGSFQPNGPLRRSGYVPNPAAWESDEPTWAARLLVGFKVGDEDKWTLDDVVPIVKRVRKRQTGDPSSSFISQRGVYRHADGDKIVDEQGAQVIIINTPDMDTSPAAFQRQMVDLAEELASELEQESIIVEIQRDGISQKVMGVVP